MLLRLIFILQVEFCYLNSKSNRKKLVRALFNVPRTSLELLPYYSRMVATLSTCMKDASSMLLQLLEEEFNFLINKKVSVAYLCSLSIDLKDVPSIRSKHFLFILIVFALQDQMNIETKIRNIRFIGELCKFRIAPPGLVFSCLKV